MKSHSALKGIQPLHDSGPTRHAVRQMKRRIGAGLVLFALTLAASFLSLSLVQSRSQQSPYVLYRSFLHTAIAINRNYVEEPDNSFLFASAVEGIARELSGKVPFATAELIASASPVDDVRELNDAFVRSLQAVREQLHAANVESASIDEVIRSAIGGMVSGLARQHSDSYSYYLPPKKARELSESLHNESFGGVGTYIEYLPEQQKILILGVLPDTPAFEAGLEVGDLIVKVDGVPLADIPIDSPEAARDRIRGKIGTRVVLTVEREGIPTLLDIPVTRRKIDVKNTFKVSLTDSIGYIRIDNFTSEAPEEMKQSLEFFNSSGSDGLILDLRSNPGGLLEAAVAVSAFFLPPGKLITYTQGRVSADGPLHYKEYRAENHSLIWSRPTVILVDRRSASASEIVTGALKDHGRAIVVGEQTFGKGSVQEIFPLQDQSSLRLTVAHYFTPGGVCIHRVGIEPDVEAKYVPRQVASATGEAEVPPEAVAPEVQDASAVEDATPGQEVDFARRIDRRSFLQRRRDALLRDNQVLAAIRVLEERLASSEEAPSEKPKTAATAAGL